MEHFDRARLEPDDEDASFPPAEPVSFSARPTASFRPGEDGVEQGFWNSAPPSLAPALPSLAAEPLRRTPSPERSAFVKLLFAMLFGSLALLLGYALLTRVL